MEKFRDIPYVRPDFEKEKEAMRRLIAGVKQASSYEELRKLYLQQEENSRHFHSMRSVANIRNDIDTVDEFYREEMGVFYSQGGEFSLLGKEANAAILASPWLEEFRKEFGDLTVRHMELGQKLASPAVVDDRRQDSLLCQEYNQTVAACSMEFHGETSNFYSLLKHMQNPDRAVRQEAFRAWAGMYAGIADKLDEQYDKMIQLRSGIAEKLGFDSYISMVYAQLERFDYGPKDVASFRKQVLEQVVPICERLYKEQAGRLGLERLEWYDEQLMYPNGNAGLIGTKDDIIAAAQKMFRELSPETGEYFDFMVEHELYDLETRLGKQGGGYCAFLTEWKAPFIFSNFNGTDADVDVLTHESGHAFESYVSSRVNPLDSMVFSTGEISEIHSMSMELFTYPWMESFFGDKADLYRVKHLATALEVIPYMVCVDEFQHRVYEEHLDAKGRRRAWRELERAYMPWRHYDGHPFLEEGGFWMQKPHIFTYPFYYINYALAQMGAFEFYQKMCANREQAWADYYKFCQSGGSRGYFETLAYAGLSNPFQEGTVKKIMDFMVTKLF